MWNRKCSVVLPLSHPYKLVVIFVFLLFPSSEFFSHNIYHPKDKCKNGRIVEWNFWEFVIIEISRLFAIILILINFYVDFLILNFWLSIKFLFIFLILEKLEMCTDDIALYQWKVSCYLKFTFVPTWYPNRDKFHGSNLKHVRYCTIQFGNDINIFLNCIIY